MTQEEKDLIIKIRDLNLKLNLIKKISSEDIYISFFNSGFVFTFRLLLKNENELFAFRLNIVKTNEEEGFYYTEEFNYLKQIMNKLNIPYNEEDNRTTSYDLIIKDNEMKFIFNLIFFINNNYIIENEEISNCLIQNFNYLKDYKLTLTNYNLNVLGLENLKKLIAMNVAI